MFRRLLLAMVTVVNLLPMLAVAQDLPPPVDWAMQASTCIPDDLSHGLLRINTNHITIRPGVVAAPKPGQHLPVLVRCPVVGEGVKLWRQLEILYRDTDGAGDAVRIRVELKRHHYLGPPSTYHPWVERVAVFDTRWRASEPTRAQTALVDIGQVLADFTHHSYWIEIGMSRSHALLLPPRVFLVRLRYVPAEPYPEE